MMMKHYGDLMHIKQSLALCQNMAIKDGDSAEIPLLIFVLYWFSDEMPRKLVACTVEIGSVPEYDNHGNFVTYFIT